MLTNYAKKIYSQNGEDGIIEHLLNNFTNLNHKCLEIGVHDGTECNTAHLIKNKQYDGILIDSHAGFNHDFYNGTSYRFIEKWLESEDVPELFHQHNLIGKYDVFSLDIDGIDYWILKTIIDHHLLDASLIVLEYQNIIGPDLAITIPNIQGFTAWEYDTYEGPNYCGASLKAFIKLLNQNYVFVGCEPLGFNGFFVNRNQDIASRMEMKDVSPCFQGTKAKFDIEFRWPRTKHMEWISV